MAGQCGAGEGARAAQTMPAGAEPVAGPRSALSLLSLPLSVVRSSFFLLSPSPPLRFEGRGIHFNATRRPLLLGLRRAGGRDAPGSLWRLVWVRRAPWPPEDLNVVLPPRLPRLGAAPEGGGCGLDPSPEGPLTPKTPRIKWHESGKERLALPFSLGPRRCPGALAARVWGAPGGGWSCSVRAGEQLRAVLCARCLRLHEREAEGLRGRSRVPPGAAAWQPGTTPHFVLVFRFICAPFSFLSFSEKGKPNKRVSLFRACKVEDI